MSRISSNLLADTLSIVQLARETALQNGKKAQADRLNSVAGPLKSLMTSSNEAKPAAPANGVMAQNDFRTLLAAASAGAPSAMNPAAASGMERNKVVAAMAEGGMTDLDIARQMGMAREEIKLILNVYQKQHKA